MKYFILGIVTLITPVYGCSTWLQIYYSTQPQELRIEKFKEHLFYTPDNLHFMSIGLIILSIISIYFFSKSKKSDRIKKPLANAFMFIAAIVILNITIWLI